MTSIPIYKSILDICNLREFAIFSNFVDTRRFIKNINIIDTTSIFPFGLPVDDEIMPKENMLLLICKLLAIIINSPKQSPEKRFLAGLNQYIVCKNHIELENSEDEFILTKRFDKEFFELIKIGIEIGIEREIFSKAELLIIDKLEHLATM